MNIKCIKESPCSVKLLYILVIISLLLNVFCLSMKCCKKDSVKKDQAIATWVDNNAEAILNSVNKYVMKQQEEAQKQQQAKAEENIKKFDKELKDTRYAGVINPKGTAVIVEFFDYNCGYCKIASKNVNELLKQRKDVKVILRAIPILGEASVYATQVGEAILIADASKYVSYYETLMNGSARSKEEVKKAVEKAGLKMDKIFKILEKNKQEIQNAIEINSNLARQIGINGTPAFIVNGNLIPGAVDAEALNSILSK